MERSSDAALVAPCVAFVTLGCAKNEADTARMRVRLAEAGFLIEDDPAEADAVVVTSLWKRARSCHAAARTISPLS